MPGIHKVNGLAPRTQAITRVWLSEAAQALIENHLKAKRNAKVSGVVHEEIVTEVGIEAGPHLTICGERC